MDVVAAYMDLMSIIYRSIYSIQVNKVTVGTVRIFSCLRYIDRDKNSALLRKAFILVVFIMVD